MNTPARACRRLSITQWERRAFTTEYKAQVARPVQRQVLNTPTAPAGNVARHRDLLAFPSEREHLMRIAVHREALEQQRGHLALELAHRLALARSLDLLEGPSVRFLDADQEPVGSTTGWAGRARREAREKGAAARHLFVRPRKGASLRQISPDRRARRAAPSPRRTPGRTAASVGSR